MISAKDIIKNNSKLEIFNETDKYIDNMPTYFINYLDINNIANNYKSFVKNINKSIGIDRYYKTQNNIIFYINNIDTTLLSMLCDTHYFCYIHRLLLIYKLLKVSKFYGISFLDIFIMLNFLTKPNDIDDNDVNDNSLYTYINGDLRDIFDSVKYISTEKAYDMLESIYHDSSKEISKIFMENNINNDDIIRFCKYYINIVYIANSYGKTQKFSFNDTVINNFKINNNVIYNILYKLCNKEYNNILINDLNNIAYKYNTTFIVVFVLLICNNSYYSIKGINRGIWNDVKQLANRYIHEDIDNINNKENLNNIININIYNQNNKCNKENNIDNSIKQNECYYIKRDKFNIKYKRIYKCIDIINNLNIAIMECIDNSGLNTQQYVLSEEDCNFLNIEYKENLEVFSTKLNWILNK